MPRDPVIETLLCQTSTVEGKPLAAALPTKMPTPNRFELTDQDRTPETALLARRLWPDAAVASTIPPALRLAAALKMVPIRLAVTVALVTSAIDPNPSVSK